MGVTLQLLARKKVKWILEQKLTRWKRWTTQLWMGWGEEKHAVASFYIVSSATLTNRKTNCLSLL